MSEEPIENKQLEVYYRPVVKKLYYWSIAILILTELFIYRIHYQSLESAGLVFGSIKFLALSSVPIGILLRLIIIVRPRIFSQFRLEGHSFWIIRSKVESELHFSQIKEIKRSILPPHFFGGFTVVLNSGKKFFFSSIIKNEELLLEAIQKYSPSLMPEKSFDGLIEETKATDIYWKKVFRKLRKPWFLAYKIFSIPAIGLGLLFTFPSLLINAEIQMLTFSIALEIVAASVLLQLVLGIVLSSFSHIKKTKLDSDKEKMIGFIAEVFYNLIGIVLFVLLASLWLA